MFSDKPTIQQMPVFIVDEDIDSRARKVAFSGPTLPGGTLVYVEIEDQWVACEVVRTKHSELHVRRKP